MNDAKQPKVSFHLTFLQATRSNTFSMLLHTMIVNKIFLRRNAISLVLEFMIVLGQKKTL